LLIFLRITGRTDKRRKAQDTAKNHNKFKEEAREREKKE
jgi:hypothetical protein